MSKTKPKATKGIDSFFGKKPDVISHVKEDDIIDIIDIKAEKSVSSKTTEVKLTKEETIPKSLTEEFYESLTPNEKITHDLGKKMLGTSYDVMRTHGFLNWLKTKHTKKTE
jgi:hypothetical protein